MVVPCGGRATVSRWIAGASKAAGRLASSAWLRPASVGVIRRAKPTSRPFGLAVTVPPAATAPIWMPQQEPKQGVPLA
ncbi:hypothetical protein D3C85_1849840 [compost metagenome]